MGWYFKLVSKAHPLSFSPSKKGERYDEGKYTYRIKQKKFEKGVCLKNKTTPKYERSISLKSESARDQAGEYKATGPLSGGRLL